MSISDLIRLAQNRLATLNSARATADRDGDADRVAQIEAEIVKTEETISTLRRI
jgi:hypothetical protein